MKLIANRQLFGDYGRVAEGEIFDCSDEIGRQLIQNGVASKAEPPKITYETKVVVPEASEVGARPGFRDLSLSDKEPAPVATASNSVLPGADVQKKGTVNRSRWRRSPRPHTGE